jgi:hypothetical protein
MRRTILRMIATGSLSAFSSTAMPALRPPGLQPARATPEPAARPAQELAPTPPPAPSGRPPPRGSLLDLSV